jgi:two-component system NtrC family sensor kinase
LLHPDERLETENAVREALASRQQYDMVHRILLPDGDLRWVRCIGDFDRFESPTCLTGITVDVTWARIQNHLVRTNERLTSMALLANAIAHEVNNPMQALGNLLYLQRTLNAEEAKKLIPETETAYERVSDLTRRMLVVFARSTRPSAIRLSDCIDEVWSASADLATKRSLKFLKRCDPGLEFYGCREDLLQLLSLLLENSLSMARDKGRIVVHAFRGKDWSKYRRPGVRIVVGDDGQGIPEDRRDDLFAPFSNTGPASAAGLGLWTCETIANKYNGHVRYRSSTAGARRGSCFCVFLALHSRQLQSELRKAGVGA